LPIGESRNHGGGKRENEVKAVPLQVLLPVERPVPLKLNRTAQKPSLAKLPTKQTKKQKI
jgi:hypothetical protein